MTARDDVLARIRSALADGAHPAGPIVRDYNTVGSRAPGAPELVDLFEERLLDYRAFVRRTDAAGVPAAIAVIVGDRVPGGVVVAPAGLEPAWIDGLASVTDDGTLTTDRLDQMAAVLTGCSIAIAETGTIVLDGSADQGRRAISLVPDLHICVVRADQIVENVPDALRLIEPTRPLTFISGGSATSDIELQRVEGVHGPRTLEVVIVLH
ncbi:MAG: LUD domain-containing protein [Mycobacteriales bacterium]